MTQVIPAWTEAVPKIGKGGKILLVAPASIAYFEIILGALRAGGCVVPLSAMSTPEQLRDMVIDSDARVLFLGGAMGAGMARFMEEFPLLLFEDMQEF